MMVEKFKIGKWEMKSWEYWENKKMGKWEDEKLKKIWKWRENEKSRYNEDNHMKIMKMNDIQNEMKHKLKK